MISPHKLYTLITLALSIVGAGVLYSMLDTEIVTLHYRAIIAFFGALNVTTFLLYGWDKLMAIIGRGRVPERVLHGAALCGGSIGAIIGQNTFRHKTQKTSFQIVYWGIVAAQCALVYWWVGRS